MSVFKLKKQTKPSPPPSSKNTMNKEEEQKQKQKRSHDFFFPSRKPDQALRSCHVSCRVVDIVDAEEAPGIRKTVYFRLCVGELVETHTVCLVFAALSLRRFIRILLRESTLGGTLDQATSTPSLSNIFPSPPPEITHSGGAYLPPPIFRPPWSFIYF